MWASTPISLCSVEAWYRVTMSLDVLVADAGELGELIAFLCDQHGIDAAVAQDCAAAMTLLRERRPRILVVDEGLEGCGAAEVVAYARRVQGCRVVSLYFSTTAATPAAPEEVTGLDGPWRLVELRLQRPFRSRRLLETLATWLGRELRWDAPHSSLAVPTAPPPPPSSIAAATAVPSPPGGASVSSSPRLANPYGFEPDDASPEDVPPVTEDGAALWVDQTSSPRFSPAPLVGGSRSRPARSGALSPRALWSVLDSFHQSESSGEVHLQRPQGDMRLYISRGRLHAARGERAQDGLLPFMAATRRLPATAIVALGDVAHDDSLVVRELQQRSLLSPADMYAGQRLHAMQLSLAAFASSRGTYRVTFDGRERDAVEPGVPIGDILLRAMLHIATMDSLRRAAPDEARFAPNPGGSAYDLHTLDLTAEERALALALDGTKSVGDLALLFPRCPEASRRGIAAGLAQLAVVRLVRSEVRDSTPF